MKAVVQRVGKTSLYESGVLISEIQKGLAVYFCVEVGDDESKLAYMAKKIANMRIFEDEHGKMNLSVLDVGGEILLISQFTLCGDCSHGNRPSFIGAARPEIAQPMYEREGELLGSYGLTVKTGVFGGDMKIKQYNDGPVTILLVA